MPLICSWLEPTSGWTTTVRQSACAAAGAAARTCSPETARRAAKLSVTLRTTLDTACVPMFAPSSDPACSSADTPSSSACEVEPPRLLEDRPGKRQHSVEERFRSADRDTRRDGDEHGHHYDRPAFVVVRSGCEVLVPLHDKATVGRAPPGAHRREPSI